VKGRHYACPMPFSPKYLNEGERVILDLHPHWWDFVRPFGYGVLGFVLALMSAEIATETSNDPMKWLEWLAVRASWLLVAMGLVGMLVQAVKWSRTHFVVTSHRVIYREGVVARIERLVGAGDLLIESGGEDGQSRFANIRDPEEVQNIIQRTVIEFEKRRD
jgi:hypothetical protein